MRVLAFLFPLILASCEIGRALLPQQATYGYIGKLRTEQPRKVGENDYLVKMHSSGGDWNYNSAICFHHADARIVDQEVQLKVFTSLCRRGSIRDFSFRINDFSQDTYNLVYIDPDGTRHPCGKLHRNYSIGEQDGRGDGEQPSN